MTDTPNSEMKVALRKYSHKKKLRKMEGALYKYRNGEIEFPEMLKRFTSIEEFYKDDD